MRLWQGRFKASPQADPVLVVPREALNALDLAPGDLAVLRVGHRRRQVWVQAARNTQLTGRDPHPVAKLGRALLAAFALHANHRLWLKRDEQGELSLGPILGFLSLRSIYAAQRACPYAGDQRLFGDVCRLAAATGGLAYVFGPEDIDWGSLTTRGYTYLPGGRLGNAGGWTTGVFPLPDVVYNRILGRSRELSPAIRQVEDRLRGLPDTASFFNPGYFDKWEVSDILSRDLGVRQVIPKTHKASPIQVKNLLTETGMVYVKPRAGFAGRGIMRVERLAPGRYRILRLEGARPIGSVGGWPSVRRQVGRIAGRYPSIVQQAVRLPAYRGRSFDLRAMVQKDESGRWRLTALVAKVAAPGGITTHIRTGGDAHLVGPVLQEVFGDTAADVRQRTGETALLVAAALERGLGRELGELGMDLAVDRTGRPWVLEVNAKPGRKVFALNPAWNRRWIERLVFYGGYRAGFTQDGRFAGFPAARATGCGGAAVGRGDVAASGGDGR